MSYRDPHLKNTLKIFENTPEYLHTFTADEREMTKYIIGTIDDFDGSDRYPVKVCVQNLRESARKIYQRLEEQSELGSGWKAESYLIRGEIIK